jgi:hypothetical protein
MYGIVNREIYKIIFFCFFGEVFQERPAKRPQLMVGWMGVGEVEMLGTYQFGDKINLSMQRHRPLLRKAVCLRRR